VCNLAKLGSQFQNRFPVLSLQPPYHLGWETSRNIDTFAKAVIHEFVHWQCYHNFRYGKSLPAIQAADTDADGLPDTVEPQYGFDPSMRQTHMSTHPELKKIEYDEEWLAYMSMSEIPMGKYNEHDLGKAGKSMDVEKKVSGSGFRFQVSEKDRGRIPVVNTVPTGAVLVFLET
jgi:hypothetical protein